MSPGYSLEQHLYEQLGEPQDLESPRTPFVESILFTPRSRISCVGTWRYYFVGSFWVCRFHKGQPASEQGVMVQGE